MEILLYFFCGNLLIIDKKHPDRKKINKIGVLSFKETILKKCADRNDDWSTEVSSVAAKMSTLSNSEEVYSVKWLKRNLKEHYKDSIVFIDEPGRSNVVCFKDIPASIISDKWYEDRKADS